MRSKHCNWRMWCPWGNTGLLCLRNDCGLNRLSLSVPGLASKLNTCKRLLSRVWENHVNVMLANCETSLKKRKVHLSLNWACCIWMLSISFPYCTWIQLLTSKLLHNGTVKGNSRTAEKRCWKHYKVYWTKSHRNSPRNTAAPHPYFQKILLFLLLLLYSHIEWNPQSIVNSWKSGHRIEM